MRLSTSTTWTLQAKRFYRPRPLPTLTRTSRRVRRRSNRGSKLCVFRVPVPPTPPWFLRKCRIQRISIVKILYVQIPKDLQAQGWDSQIPNGLAWRTPVGPGPRSKVERAALGSLGVPRGLLENGLGAARGSGSVQALQSAAEGVVP